jgi:mannose-6-phosphate isomerase-like protein (cupin superfamily)
MRPTQPPAAEVPTVKQQPPVEAFDVPTLEEARAEVQHRTGELYLEFLRRDSMSCGLYVLEAGAQDPQEPHQQDEVYVVLDGRAQLMVAGQDQPVGPGSIVFVARTVPHRFHDVSQRLSVLVFFAPAETG